MKIAIYSIKEFEKDYLLKANNNKHDLFFIKDYLSENTVHLAKGFDCITIFSNDDASSTIIEKLKNQGVKFIALRSAGYNHVDIEKAKLLGLKVANVPDYSPNAIAEHAVALMLSLNRKIVRADKRVKEHNFSINNLVGFDMFGKTVGVVGTGKIGEAIIKILNGFGCNILTYDIKPKLNLEKTYNIKYVTLKELYKHSDIITLHLPLNDKTKYYIDKSEISQMKKGVMIINTSRGGLINTKEVIKYLKSGKIGYLGIDVYENEKGLFFEDWSDKILQDDCLARLLSFQNVLITSHQAFLTDTALKNIANTTFYNINCWEYNKKSKNELA